MNYKIIFGSAAAITIILISIASLIVLGGASRPVNDKQMVQSAPTKTITAEVNKISETFGTSTITPANLAKQTKTTPITTQNTKKAPDKMLPEANNIQIAQAIKTIKANPVANDYNGEKIVKTDEEWRKQLTPQQFYVLRQKGTEEAFTGKYTHNKKRGAYHCAACGLALFSSESKFDSGTGWPSFYQPIAAVNILEQSDKSLEEERTEVTCARCGSHLGHVFDDGPEPTGLRYCINSVALKFKQQN